jgi:plastocyanin
MSDAGSATFNNHITASGNVTTDTDGRMISNLTEVIEVTVVDDGGNHYAFEGATTPNLVVSEGKTYRFDQSDSSNSTHPFAFSLTEDGSTYTTGVTTRGTAGSAGAYTELKVTKATAGKLFYKCTAHSGMGNQGNILKNDLTNFGGNIKVDAAFTVTQTASSITGANNIDLSAKNNYNLTLTGNVTLTPTNLTGREGQSGLIALIQDSSGGHSITLNSLFKTPRGSAITFDTTANGISLMSYYVVNTSNVAVNYLGPFS